MTSPNPTDSESELEHEETYELQFCKTCGVMTKHWFDKCMKHSSADSESLKNELWDVFEYNFGKDRREGRDIETMDELMSLIEAEITKRETALLDELEAEMYGVYDKGIEPPQWAIDFIASKRPTNNKGER